jgi:hypothetical protein
MLRSFKRGALAFAASTLCVFAFNAAAAAPSVGLATVDLTCTDGTSLALALDSSGLADVSDAVAGINLFPAGDPALACNISQPASLSGSMVSSSSASASANRAHDFAVGGGQLLLGPFGLCTARENFAFNAHVPAGTAVTPGTAQPGAGGTYNQTRPAGCLGSGQLVAKVDCLEVTPSTSGGGVAFLTAKVTRSTFVGISVGDEISSRVTDSGTSVGDTLGDALTTSPCTFVQSPSIFPVVQGNITIKSGA